NARTDQKSWPAGIARQHALEIAEVFRQPLFDQIMRTAMRFALLVFVIEAGGDRMMAVVNLGNKIGDRKLKLMRPQPSGPCCRRQRVPFAEKQQNVRGLADD